MYCYGAKKRRTSGRGAPGGATAAAGRIASVLQAARLIVFCKAAASHGAEVSCTHLHRCFFNQSRNVSASTRAAGPRRSSNTSASHLAARESPPESNTAAHRCT